MDVKSPFLETTKSHHGPKKLRVRTVTPAQVSTSTSRAQKKQLLTLFFFLRNDFKIVVERLLRST